MNDLPPADDRSRISQAIQGILATPDVPNANGRVYPRRIMERELARLRGKKTPLQEFTERVHNDDYDMEVENPEIAAQISEEIRRELPDMPRFTIRRLKMTDQGELRVDIQFDLPFDANKLAGKPISIGGVGRINGDGTVDLG